jgi:hypothetical protein
MVAPSTLALELIVLFLSGGSLALSGVLAMALVEPRSRARGPRTARLPAVVLLRELVLPPTLAILVVTLLGAGLIELVHLRLGSSAQLALALSAGGLGGLGVALLALGVTVLGPRPALERPVELPKDRRSNRGWVASGAIFAGAGGAALLVLIGLYVTFDGHEPVLLVAAFGAGLAALAGRAPAWVRSGGPPEPPEIAGRTAWIRRMAPFSVGRALDLYLLFLLAGTAGSVLAFVPSVIRLLQPNAVLFPVAALAAIFVASLIAIPFATGENAPTGSFRRVAELGPTAFGFIALLALAPPYLPGGLGLFLAGVAGLLAGPAVVLLWAAGGARTGSASSPRFLRAVAPAILLGGTVVGSYWLGNLSVRGALDLSTPGLGPYGIGIATVTAVGTLTGLFALDLGGRFTASLNGAGEAQPVVGSTASVDRATAAAGVGGVFGAGLACVVLLSAFVALIPLEAGVAPGSLVISLDGSGEGRLLGGVALGLLLLIAVAALLTYRGPPSPEPTDRPPGESLRLRAGDWLGPLLLAVLLPLVTAQVLGAVGLVGLVIGAVLGSLWHGFSSELLPLGPPEGGPARTLVPTLALAVLTALLLGGTLFFGVHLGAL